MAAITKRISSSISECGTNIPAGEVSYHAPFLITRSKIFLFLTVDISWKDLFFASETIAPWGPSYYIFQMAAIRTAETLIAIIQ